MEDIDMYMSAWSDEDGEIYVSGTHDIAKANIEAKKYIRENIGEEEATEFSFTEEFAVREWWDDRFFHLEEEYIPSDMISSEEVSGWIPIIRQTA